MDLNDEMFLQFCIYGSNRLLTHSHPVFFHLSVKTHINLSFQEGKYSQIT